ncbi:hypothetical protein FISHEDRAFT_50937 [Fistulina hepatica ATCC 64428]|uniref:TPR-like protein n=1 Tax=Fistulina hepatica ATCC 64428 TaxID=1128425 RepID=A0A0D7A410_9AGAR|nr:hypothetical protein FISHEDRAFT_50937 [Fistulina hepatica ATCC 64428]
MATVKEKYYWGELRLATAAGDWASRTPAKAYDGTSIPWHELFRKFNKHCKNGIDVCHFASHTQALALLLAFDSSSCDDDPPPEKGVYSVRLGDECMLPWERVRETTESYHTLRDYDSPLMAVSQSLLAYYAYALGSYDACLQHLRDIPDLADPHCFVPPASAAEGAHPILGWGYAPATRCICLQGMAHEKLHPKEPERALKHYARGISLLSVVLVDLSPSPVEHTSFTPFHEAWRWTERLLWRAIVLAAQTYDVDSPDLWQWFELYDKCSLFWPPSFRSWHRSAVCALRLRAIVLRYSTTIPAIPSGKLPAWFPEARAVVHEYHAILTASSSFPRAGQRNLRVEDFVDLCVAIWETSGASGDHASWVIEILWWATRLTFNSFRVYRHMMRLALVSGDISLAKRTLKLYAQVVSKAHQASDAGVGADADTDRHWVETLVSGARMLCRCAAALPGLDGIADARAAGDYIQQARTRLNSEDRDLVASVDLAEGIWNSIMALKEENPYTRTQRLDKAHSLLVRSIEVHPTPAGHFHLALSHARHGSVQNLDEAIVNASYALEGDPTEIRYWHFLGLLLAAQEKWKAADEILMRAEQIGDEYVQDDETEREVDGPPATVTSNIPVGINGTAYPASRRSSVLDTPVLSVRVLESELGSLEPASQLLKPTLDHPLPSQQDTFEHALQLRMTQLALAEYVEGAEGAVQKGVEIFHWIAERRGGASTGSRRTLHLSDFQNDVIEPSATPQAASATSHGGGDSNLRPMPISITVEPATPDAQSHGPSNVDVSRASVDGSARKSMDGSRRRSFDVLPSPRSSIAVGDGNDLSPKDQSKGKKVQRLLKHGVHQGHQRLTTISRKIGSSSISRHSGLSSRSSPDLNAALRPENFPYQASSIHSRRITSFVRPYDVLSFESPPPPPPPTLPPIESKTNWNARSSQERRLVSNLWLMSAATFRRLGKIEQARGAIQDAEVRDENNPAVWVQLGLYYLALDKVPHAIDALQKALFVAPDDVEASIHLCRIYLDDKTLNLTENTVTSDNVDLAAGILSRLTKAPAWDVPEAWFFLARAYTLQGRKDRAQECLKLALTLAKHRGVREISKAIGWCI